jgi:hypothetical protein
LYLQIQAVRKEKYDAKEKYYGKLVDYEIEQKFIRDIQWLTQTKAAFMERFERNLKYKAQ